MERKLSTLFSFQKFEGNADLQKIIDATHARYAVRELDVDEMEWVSAAGIPEVNVRKDGKDAEHKH